MTRCIPLAFALVVLVASPTEGAMAAVTDDPPSCDLPLDIRSAAGRKLERARADLRRSISLAEARIREAPPSDARLQHEGQLAKAAQVLAAVKDCPAPDRAARAYVDEVIDRIEECGTRNFPNDGKRRLYGTAGGTFLIASDGTVGAGRIERTSGIPELDQHVLRIIAASGPFGPVPTGMLDGRFEQIRVAANFRFAHDRVPTPVKRPKSKCSL